MRDAPIRQAVMHQVGLWSLLFAACGPAVGVDDGGIDAGQQADGGQTDAGNGLDAGTEDGGLTDGGAGDAGATDAGADAGTDAGTPLDAGTPRRFVVTGSGNGLIRVFAFDERDGGLGLLSTLDGGAGTSFLAADVVRGRLYAVNEGSAQVAAFAFDTSDGGLRFLNRVSSGGNGPAHVSIDATGRLVLVANYTGGTIAVLPVTDAGLAAPSQIDPAGGQAHQILTDATNTRVYVPCKAADWVAQYALDGGALVALAPRTVDTANGAGPRHLALHPTLARAYLINELDSTVETFSIDAQGRLTSVQTLSSLPAGFMGANTGAEIAVHPNGRFVFASNRGHNSIVRFQIDQMSGQLTLLGHTPTGGNTPRHFSLDSTGRWMLVGNQGSGTVVVFGVDPTTGGLTNLGTGAMAAGVAFAGFVEPR